MKLTRIKLKLSEKKDEKLGFNLSLIFSETSRINVKNNRNIN